MTLNEAIKMGKQGKIEDWVHIFLNQPDPHGNAGLSKGLKLQPRYWYGPMEVKFTQLMQGCGPSKNYKFYEVEESWNITIIKFKQKLDKGEMPPPLIIEYKYNQFHIADGNHRYASMKKFGMKKYWCIIWFNSKEEYLNFKEKL